ncbi:MAG: universal stress protein [Pseudomonadota bacterium]
MFKNILVATDTITGPDAPVLAAIDLAQLRGSGLHILHVLESASAQDRNLVKHFKTNQEIRADGAYVKTVQDALSAAYGKEADSAGKACFHVTTGYPWEEILRIAREVDTDLIMVGPHSDHAAKKGVIRGTARIGSTVQNVIAHEHCPVMIVSRPIEKDKLLFKRIVVGIDFSVACECALCLSVKLSRNFGSILYPFFMLPVPPYPKHSESDSRADMTVLRQRLEEFCDIYLDGIDHEYKVWAGVLPHQEVLECARKLDADLIMLGSHTKKSNGKWYAGSVVEQVSHGAQCPVVSVSDPQALEKWKDIRVPALDGEAPMDRSIHLFTNTPSPDGDGT